MPDKPMRVWISRDNHICGRYRFYYQYEPSKALNLRGGFWDQHDDIKMLPSLFHALYPDVELKTGEGPVEVQLEMYEVRNGKVIRE